MLGDKRGLSTIVVTLIIILISLVAVGIVWVVVRAVIQSGTGRLQSNAECITTDVEATSVSCAGTPAVCTLVLKRTGTGTADIGGVKLIFRNTTAVPETSSGLIDPATGNILPLSPKTVTGIATTLDSVDTVDINVYFQTASGEQQICQQTNTYKFA